MTDLEASASVGTDVRILFLNPVGILGGAERALLDLLACLKQLDAGLSLHLLAGTPGPLLDAARALGVDARLLALPERLSALGDSALRGRGPVEALRFAGGLAPAPFLLAGYGRSLRREVAGLRPDLLHSNGIKTHLLSPITAGLPLKRVWHIHDFLGERPLVRRALRTLAPLASAAIANSGAVGEDTRDGAGPRARARRAQRRGRGALLTGARGRCPAGFTGGPAARARGDAACGAGGHVRTLEGA
ncbi:glycosyltransferase [Pyxidicoccus sp. 3LFB2]